MAAITTSVLMGGTRPSGQNCGQQFGEFYTSHYRYVLRVCQRFLWRHEDAEDAASEVFLKLHSLEGEQQPIHSLPWLCKVTGRHCIDRLRQVKAERRRRVEEEHCETLPDELTNSPLARVLLRERSDWVREGLRRLPRESRILLVLHYYRQLSYAEIADALGKQLPAVKTGVFRAKRMLKAKIASAKSSATESLRENTGAI
jgi:RNA polymerase sigma-70 factor (ECF subfamily)